MFFKEKPHSKLNPGNSVEILNKTRLLSAHTVKTRQNIVLITISYKVGTTTAYSSSKNLSLNSFKFSLEEVRMKKAALFGTALFFAAANASAAIVDYSHNDRDPAIALDGSLQTLFDNKVSDSSGNAFLDATNDQSHAAYWSQSDGQSSTSYLISMVSGSGALGIYSIGNPGVEHTFSMGSANQTNFSIATTGAFAGDLLVGGSTLISDFGQLFGFFFDADGSDATTNDRFYTQDSENGGDARALSYQLEAGSSVETSAFVGTATGLGTDDWILAFESSAAFDQNDYLDGVFLIKDMEVPAPATLALMGLGLLGLAYSNKRKKA